jgi:hypothetical protein
VIRTARARTGSARTARHSRRPRPLPAPVGHDLRMTAEGFTDPGTVLADLADEVLVVCPTCRHRATIVAWPPPTAGLEPGRDHRDWFHPRRLVCSGCGRQEHWAGRTVATGDAVDPWFGHPLWLRTSARGHELWAWNGRHVDLLDQVASAGLRRRPVDPPAQATLVAELPGWVKVRQHRDDVRAAVRRLRAQLGSMDPERG